MKRPTQTNQPLRVLDMVLKGGLGAGKLGVVMARHGTGKVAVLTSITIDHAMAEQNVLHVAVGKSLSDVRAYDDEVLHQICERFDLHDRASIMTTVERHKQIYAFRDPADFTAARLRHAMDFLAEHAEFKPTQMEIQGWPDFRNLDPGELMALKSIAEDYGCEVWLTAHTHRSDNLDARGVPDWLARFDEQFEVIMSLEPEGEHIPIKFVRVHGEEPREEVHLEFDPRSMLIRWR